MTGLPSQLGYEVNGARLFPLSAEERHRQLTRLEERRLEIEDFHQKPLTSKEQAQEIALCINSFEHFCDFYLYTFDPRNAKEPAPRFILYEFQRRAAETIIAHILDGENLLIEKTRDMGLSWLVDAVILWFWLFHEYFHALMGSRVEDLVDNYSIDSLFGKIDFMLSRLPDWMKRIVPYNPQDNRCRKLLAISSYQHSMISGESANKAFGRGPRKKVVVFDEFAHTELDDVIWTGIADTAPCKILVSTPNGNTNKFAELRFAGQIDVLTLHWTQHPLKTVEWYLHACGTRDEKTIAQELNIDYTASGGKIAFPQLRTNRHRIVVPEIQLDPQLYTFDMSLDYGTTNPSALHVHAVAKTKALGEITPRIKTVWEYYEPSSPKKISEAIRACPYFPLVRRIWADPSMFFNNQWDDDKKAVTNLAWMFQKYYNIHLSAGKRGDGFFLAQINSWWESEDDPRYEIFDCCVNLIHEFEQLQYVSQTSNAASKHNAPEKLRDKLNHGIDGCKYFVNSTFDAPIFTPPAKQKFGYDQLQEEMHGLKKSVLQKLADRGKNNARRYFKWV